MATVQDTGLVQDMGHMDTEDLVTDLSTTFIIEARKIVIMIDLFAILSEKTLNTNVLFIQVQVKRHRM